jgi:biopolymer transport protein ExbD
MAMQVGSDSGEENDVVSAINTTPLVDVMLVLLIIFLITIPVVTQSVPVQLPDERNQALQTKPENINISVDINGDIYWGMALIRDMNQLQRKLYEEAVKVPQPEVHIRGDRETRYENVNNVVAACQRASIFKVGFITEPPPRGG